MKYFLFLLLFISCTTKVKKQITKIDEINDSLEIKRMADSMTKETIRGIYKNIADSTGASNSPVIVTKARLFKEEYSSSKSIELTYKNVSGKRIAAIKFMWYGINAFGEPADMGGAFDGLGGGFMDDGINPGAKKTSVWSIYSRDAKKVTSAFVTEIAFADGTKWEFKKNN